MKYLTPLMLTAFLMTAPAHAQQTSATGVTATTDTKAVLSLLKGNVDMYGTNFGSTEFQRGILQLAQQGAIKVRVLTNPAVVQNMKPLKAVGAKVYALNANYTNSMLVVQGGPLIIPTKSNYQIVTDQKQVAAITGLMTQYWQVAKAF